MFFVNHLDNMQPSSLKILFYLLNLLNQYLILRLSTLSKANNQSIVQQASYILLRLSLADLKKIQKWYFNLYEVITFSQALSDTELCGITEDEMASFAGSDDGFTIKKRCKFFIFLNDRKLKNRILFTVAYELGHIESGHLYKINCLGLTMTTYYDNDSQSIFFRKRGKFICHKPSCTPT